VLVRPLVHVGKLLADFMALNQEMAPAYPNPIRERLLSVTSASFKFTPLAISGAWLIEPLRKTDDRGHFLRSFCAREFAEMGLETDFVQRSISFNTQRGTLRGLHFQVGAHAETKLVRCTRGKIFDAIADLRPEQPTFAMTFHLELSAESATMVLIPPGCAHGFLTLVDASEVYYEITPAYHPQVGAGINWSDPALAIPWPFQPEVISEKDQMLPVSADYFSKLRAEGAGARSASVDT
jgi:dTDP-4-dehydrorhamnose 3,5-epimerase